MGLLDSLLGGVESNATLSPQDAFAGVLWGASGFINNLVIKLEMNSGRAKDIVQVMVYKNQG